MSIKDFLTPLRSKTTVLPENFSDTCSPSLLHSESLLSPTTIPDSQQTRVEPKLNSSSNNSQEDSSHLSRSQTLCSGLATMEEKESTKKATKVNPPPKVNNHTQETRHHVTCSMLMSSAVSPFQESRMPLIPLHTYLEMSRELHTVWNKAKERKNKLWQLLLQRNAIQAIPIGPVAVVPSYTQALITSTPRIYPRELPYWSRSGSHKS